jgi:glycosyltransferase involved in cell wall biosynthesis
VRILLVSNYYPEHVGGIETVASSLALGYRKRGHEVRWIAADIRSQPHAAGADDVPVRVWNGIERLGFPYPLPSPLTAARVRRHVVWSEVVHMHDCLYAVNVATFAASRREHRPVLLTQHVAKVPYPSPLLRALQSVAYASLGRAVLSRAEQVVFVSDQVRRWFEPRVRFRKPPLLIENGIDADLFQPPPERERDAFRVGLGVNGSRPLLLFVGRFVEKKGVRLLRPLIEATPSCDWVLIGRAGDVDPSKWRLSNVKLLETMKPIELRSYYAAADLLVLPSHGEGFPVVAQEAMACGTPALLSETTATGLPAIRGVVFTSKLTSEELHTSVLRAVDTLGADAGFRTRVASFARERWRTDTMVQRYEEQLEALLH